MNIVRGIKTLWNKIPYAVRMRLVFVLTFVGVFNVAVWVFAFHFARIHPVFLGLITLAYGLGLRHAVDADHIAAIDNTTRKLMLDGKRPVGVGLFFSLGHSTIVVILSLLIALSSSFIKHSLPQMQAIGTLIGTSVSSFFLILIGIINLVAFLGILRIFRRVTREKSYKEVSDNELHLQGFLSRILRPFLKIVSTSWHMYFVGFLFGLGFDTASEVGLLSLSAISGATGISIWEILLLPLAFTAGMALIDTLDGVLMLGAYEWAYIKPVRKLYYNLNITFISVVVALLIGGVEALQLISSQLNLQSSFFEFINKIDLGNVGYIIILVFLLTWVVSLGVYKLKRYDRLSS